MSPPSFNPRHSSPFTSGYTSPSEDSESTVHGDSSNNVPIAVSDKFDSHKDIVDVLTPWGARTGFKWRLGPSKKVDGAFTVAKFVCSSSKPLKQTESTTCDLANWRNSESIKTNCAAHFIFCWRQNCQVFECTSQETAHNHGWHHTPGQPFPLPANNAKRAYIKSISNLPNLDTCTTKGLLQVALPNSNLEP